MFTRIDRVLVNPKWHTMYDSDEAAFLLEGEFDHSPIVMSCYKCPNQMKPFRFYNMWTNAPTYDVVVEGN